MKTSRRGFTLVELMVAIIIVAALAAIAVPIVRKGIAKSHEATCLSNLRQIGLGLEAYLQDNSQRMPVWDTSRPSKESDTPVIETGLEPYLGEDASVFECPADREQFRLTGSSYSWNSLLNDQPVAKLELAFGSFVITDNPSRIPLVLDKESWHPGGDAGEKNYLYADLSAEGRMRLSAGP